MKRKIIVTCLASAFASTAMAQQAQGGIETIVVTATKRAQGMQDVPQTISAFSEQSLKDMGAQDFAAVANSMAGVEIRQEQAGQGGVAIRGISELNMGNLYGGTGSATGFYLDEMPLTAAGRFPGISPFDMQRVEVLKGPQGTLFGEGSLAGTVRFIANKPKFNKVDAALDATYSQTQGGGANHALNVMGNVPMSDNVAALRFSLYEKKEGGYTDARITDGTTVFNTINNANTEKSTGGRVALRIAPTGDLTITGTLLTNDTKNGLRNRAAENSLIGSFSVPENTKDKLDAYNLNIEYALSFADLVANVAHSERKITAYLDQAGFIGTVNGALAALGGLAGFLGVPWVAAATGVYGLQNMNAKADTLELRLVSNDPGPLKWTGGGYHKKVSTLYSLDGNSTPAVPAASWAAVTTFLTGTAVPDALVSSSKATIKQTAIFGEVSYDITKQFQILGGGRMFKETRNSFSSWSSAFALLTGGAAPGSAATQKTASLFNPKVTATYKFTPDVMTYATYSQGFRSGGQNDFLALTPGAPADYKHERLMNHELGLKTTLLNNRLMFNVSGYYMKWKDLQQVVAQGIGGIGEAIGNVGDAHSTGFDLETKWKPTDRLELNFNAALLKAELDNSVVLGPSAGNVTVPNGTRIPGTAKQSFSLGSTYRYPVLGDLTGFLGGRVTSRGSIISNLPSFTQTTPGATTVDLKLGVESKKWQVYGFIDNATNQHVALREDPTGDILTGQRTFQTARPRTVGINFRMGL
ncbi:MAG: TonB-dependent receptor [Sulfuritalea sp.]|nr:TonB-dependent receptor [Sulfuritalea sp.]